MEYYSYSIFATMNNTTIRTLRYYEKIGLLTPKIMNGLKKIQAEHLIKMQTIELLKSANYTLTEIKSMLESNSINNQIILQKDLLELQLIKTQSMLELIAHIQKTPKKNIASLYQAYYEIEQTKNLEHQFSDVSLLQKRIHFHHKYTTYSENFHIPDL